MTAAILTSTTADEIAPRETASTYLPSLLNAESGHKVESNHADHTELFLRDPIDLVDIGFDLTFNNCDRYHICRWLAVA